MTDLTKNGWNEWANFVLHALEELKKQHDDSDKKIEENKDKYVEAIGKLYTAIKILETKMTIRAAFSGAVAAMVPVVVALVVWLISK